MLISQPLVMLRHSTFCVRTESLCCFLAGLFPKVFVFGLLTWSLAVTFAQTEFYIFAAAAIMYVLSVVAYFQVIWAGPGSPMDYRELHLSRTSENPFESGTALLTKDVEALYETHTFKDNLLSYRLCTTCKVWKPDRCHHCLTCKRCHLRMDHHCPWFAGCIGFRNHKFFVQCISYNAIYSAVVFFGNGSQLLLFLVDEAYSDRYISLNLVFVCLVAMTFFVTLLIFACFTIYLLLRNYTTIEFGDLESRHVYDDRGNKTRIKHIYDMGLLRNWRLVMGPRWFHWLLPTLVAGHSLGNENDGVHFEVNEKEFRRLKEHAKLQEDLNAQLARYSKTIRGQGSPVDSMHVHS